MRDQTPETINNVVLKISINSHSIDGTHWVLVIKKQILRLITLIPFE